MDERAYVWMHDGSVYHFTTAERVTVDLMAMSDGGLVEATRFELQPAKLTLCGRPVERRDRVTGLPPSDVRACRDCERRAKP